MLLVDSSVWIDYLHASQLPSGHLQVVGQRRSSSVTSF